MSLLSAAAVALLAFQTSEAPEAPPPSPTARIAQRQRFLLYDTVFHEQVNKQRRALMFYLDLAMRLKRTLVLPRTRLLRRAKFRSGSQFEPNADYASWGELFNASALARAHPVMELEQFVELHGGVALHVRVTHKGCTESEGETSVPFNGLDLPAARSICATGMQYDARSLSTAEMSELDSIAFSDVVDQLSPQGVLPLRPYVRYTDAVYDAAAAFARDAFNGQPFLAIHWRRTDFLQVRTQHEHALQSAPMLIAHARAVMRAHAIRHVYLATDSEDKAELAAVFAALQPARYVPHSPAVSLQAKTELANVEIAICAMGARFLGTRTSSFTLAITEERQAVFGHPPETGVEMGAPPEEDHGKDEL